MRDVHPQTPSNLGRTAIALVAILVALFSCVAGCVQEGPPADDDDDGDDYEVPSSSSSTTTCNGYSEAQCDDACYFDVGLTEGTCTDSECRCGGDYADFACADGTAIYCFCEGSAFSPPTLMCSGGDFSWDLYTACATDEPDYSLPPLYWTSAMQMRCWAQQREAMEAGLIDCNGALSNCPLGGG